MQVTSLDTYALAAAQRAYGEGSDELAAIAESLGAFTDTDPAEYLKTMQALQWSPAGGDRGPGLAA